MMQPFARHTAIAAPLIKDDINTDQIAPILHLRGLKEDYRAMLFHRARRRDDGSEDPDFVLNKPQFRGAGILVTGQNFGAGSSRESAVWSMLANGIRVIVAKSFADIYRENCLHNGLLPVVLGALPLRVHRDLGPVDTSMKRRRDEPRHVTNGGVGRAREYVEQLLLVRRFDREHVDERDEARVLGDRGHEGSLPDEPVADRIDDKFGGLVDSESVHHVGAMTGDSIGAELQLCGNFFIGFSVYD